jgi:hypothetical protein
VNIGLGGEANWAEHLKGKKHNENAAKMTPQELRRVQLPLSGFFPKASTVQASGAPSHPPAPSLLPLSYPPDNPSTSDSAQIEPPSVIDVDGSEDPNDAEAAPSALPKPSLISELRIATAGLPTSVQKRLWRIGLRNSLVIQ